MSSNPHDFSNQQLLDLLQQDSRKAIDLLFQRDYEYLCRIAYRVLKDTNRSEDIVQDVFFELWKKRETIQIKSSIKAYLRRAVINKTLNFIRDQKIRMDDDSSLQYLDNKENIQHNLEASEMQIRIEAALEELPPKCKMVFMLSRYEQLSYQEIADKLEISTKTVENHISKALKRLRIALKPYM
ncbi:MAG: RNA polymerase sigma-70 factor [Bacteroidota bacterium]